MITFERISAFPQGTLYRQLLDAYSFDVRCRIHWEENWREHDRFFYAHPELADRYGFVTLLHGKPIGHITWDPRRSPESVSIGHNCILTACKGNGYGKQQLREALRRIRTLGAAKIIVTTNALTLPAQKNYESVGFIKTGERPNPDTPFAGNYIDYELRP